MICDVHAHYTPKNFSEFMATGLRRRFICGQARNGAPPVLGFAGDIRGPVTLRMRRVEKQVLSPTTRPISPMRRSA